jgi:uncharacterized protein (TIGR02391 family)
MVDEAGLTRLIVIQRQASALLQSISGMVPSFRFEGDDPTIVEAEALINQARELLSDSEHAGVVPKWRPRPRPASSETFAYAQDIRATVGSLNAALPLVIERLSQGREDLPSKITLLEARLSDAESRSTAFKDDELHKRCFDLLLRPGKADTAVREAAVVLEDRIRKVSELAASDIGVVLVDKALNPRAGVLTIDGPDSERRAVHELFRGVIGAFKNPTSHKIVPDYDATRARQVVGLVDVLLQLLQETRRRDPLEVASADSTAT